MLTEIHGLLRDTVYKRGHIDPREVDISFESLSSDWLDALIRPTLDFALIDIQENLNMRHSSPQTTLTNGHAEVRMPPRRVDLRYLVTALTTDSEDSHRLLWRAMATLMRTPELPTENLPEDIRRQVLASLHVRVAQADTGINVLDVWSAAGSAVRPSFCCVLTVPVDLEILFEVPLVLERASKYVRKDTGDVAREYLDVGGIVRDKDGEPVRSASVAVSGTALNAVADEEGHYVLHGVPRGKVTLQVARPDGPSAKIGIEIPATSYDLRVD